MSYQTVYNSFQAILNRDDATPAILAEFLQQGLSRIQRDMRLPSMERQLIVNVGASGTSMLLVPQDLVELIDIIWTPGSGALIPIPRALRKLPAYRDYVVKAAIPLYVPECYARVQAQYWLAGPAVEGDTLQILYYGAFSDWPTPNADNELIVPPRIY